MNILIKNVDIVTCDDTVRYIKDGNIGIGDGRIVFVNGTEEEIDRLKAGRILDGRRKLAMPGLVNTHTHCAMTVMRNFADDLALEEWLFQRVFPTEARLRPEDVYWGTLLGTAEMIRSGTTTFADMYLHMDEVARAVCDSGIRANLARSPLKFGADGEAGTVDETQDCYAYHGNWHGKGEGRLKVYIEVHSAYLFNEESLKMAAALAGELKTGIHIHILETKRERAESIERYGMDSAEICMKCGIFEVPVIAAHCVHLSDNDISILKEKGVHVAHNPTSNLKLGSGIARLPDLLDAGINVGLGTDGTASNNNLNLFEEMHLAAILHKGTHRNPTLVPAEQAVKMATVNGAAAAGFGGQVGAIRKGMKADLLLLDTDKPHFYPMNNPLSAIVYCAQGADVETVIIDGNIVMENRELKTMDEEQVKYRVAEISERILGKR